MVNYHILESSCNKNEKRPSIDVVIPVYNGQKYILQTLNSVLHQTYPPKKIIVVDDGSTDKTPELVKNFRSTIPIEHVKKTNGGLSSARNAGISLSTAEYIAFLDADDEWYPEKLEKQIEVFQNSNLKNIGVVYCKYSVIDDTGSKKKNYFIDELNHSVRGDVFLKLLEGNKVHSSGSGVLVKKRYFDKAGVFDETLKACEDWDMWLRLSKYCEFDFVLKDLVKIRKHKENMQRDSMHMLVNLLIFYNKWLESLSKNEKCLINWRRRVASYSIHGISWKKIANTTTNILSNNNRKKLFSITFGSVKLYILLSLPRIALHFFIYQTLKGFRYSVKTNRNKERLS